MVGNPFWCSAGFYLFQGFNVNYASYPGNTPFVIGDGVKQVIESLKEPSVELFCWFANNEIKAPFDSK